MCKMLAVGQIVLGRYEIIELIAIGGQGVLARARDLQTGREVAIKQLLASPNQSNYVELVARAKREAQIHVGHPKVVDPTDYGEENGQHFTIFPYVEGQPLSAYLASRGGKLPADEAASIAKDIAEGLAAVHAKGYVHRDIKPDNILIDPAGAARIVDFGICRDSSDKTIAQAEGFIGSIAHMSPEQVASPGSEDHLSDLYSLGVVFYETLTGYQPVQGRDAGSILVSICEHVPPSPRQLEASIPEHIDQACMRLLAKQRGARFQSAAEFIQALAGQSQPAQARFCRSCGLRVERPASYCTGCGAQLNTSGTPPARCLACGAPAPDTSACSGCGRPFRQSEHRLSFVTGSLSGQVFRMPEGTYFVGREQLSPRDQHISRRHFSVFCTDGVVRVQDAGSTNKTYVEGQPADGAIQLRPKQQVTIGGNVARYTLGQ